MATKIESTVLTAAEDLAKTDVPKDRHVTVIIHDQDEDAKRKDLRKAIAEGDTSGDPISVADVFADVRSRLESKNRK